MGLAQAHTQVNTLNDPSGHHGIVIFAGSMYYSDTYSWAYFIHVHSYIHMCILSSLVDTFYSSTADFMLL